MQKYKLFAHVTQKKNMPEFPGCVPVERFEYVCRSVQRTFYACGVLLCAEVHCVVHAKRAGLRSEPEHNQRLLCCSR